MIIKFLLTFSIIFLFGFGAVSAQESNRKPCGKRISIHKENEPLRVIIGSLIRDSEIAIGFEESSLNSESNDFDFAVNLPTPSEVSRQSSDGKYTISSSVEELFEPTEIRFTLNAENACLDAVLNDIVGQMKNYQWTEDNGVVNIFPSKGRNHKYEKLLDIQISKFIYRKNMPIGNLRDKLLNLPEVKDFLVENQLKTSKIRKGSIDNSEKRLLDTEINFSNLTLKQLLNKITAIKKGGWILKKHDLVGTKGDQYVDIDI
jgi:hypothetical protein